MPILEEPREHRTVTLPPRSARYAGRTDVLVVGGGPAGCGAALAASEAGAEVVLVERYGFLGGNATAALVMPLMSFHNEHKQAVFGDGDATRLLPTDHGEGEPVVAGVLWRLLDRLSERGGCVPPSVETGYTVPFDPEIFKLVLLDLLDEAGVRMLFHSFASSALPLEDGWRVVFETKSGPVAIDAGVVVDGTGDGDVAAACGAPYEIGRDEDGLVQPMTLMFRVADFVRPRFAEYVRTHPDQWRGVHGLWDLVQEATGDGELALPREDVLFFATPHPGEVSVNSTRVTGALGVSVWDLTAPSIWPAASSRRSTASCAGTSPASRSRTSCRAVPTSVSGRPAASWATTRSPATTSWPHAPSRTPSRTAPTRSTSTIPRAPAPSSSAYPPAASTTSRCAVCCRGRRTGCWSRGAASRARTWRTPPTV